MPAMPGKFQKNSETTMRVMSAVSYLTGGIAGLIYAMMNGRSSKDDFFRYHFMQALLVTMLFVFFSWCECHLVSIFSGILGIFGSAGAEASGMLGTALSLILLGVKLLYLLIVIAGVVQSFRGKYLDIPVVSKLIRINMR